MPRRGYRWAFITSDMRRHLGFVYLVGHRGGGAGDHYGYLKKRIRHIDPDAVLEIVAFDSTETYVIASSEVVINKLMEKYPKAESLEKYVSGKRESIAPDILKKGIILTSG